MRPLTNKGPIGANYQAFLTANDPFQVQQAGAFAYIIYLIGQGTPGVGPGNQANRRTITVALALEAIRISEDDNWNVTALAPATLTPAVATFFSGRLIDGNEPYYRQAKNELTQAIGEYCSYCEMHLAETDLDIEHKLPKGQFPLRALEWTNFVLACNKCNDAPAKGENPSRRFGIQRLLTHHNLPPLQAANNQAPNNPLTGNPYTYLDIQGAANNYTLWPDVSPQTLSFYRYVLRWINPNNNNAVTDFPSLTIPVDAGNVDLFQETNNLPFASINLSSVLGAVQPNVNLIVKVEIDVINVVAATPQAQFGAQYTRDMVRLNDDLTPQGGNASADRRIFSRTKAWLTATSVFGLLNSLLLQVNNQLQVIQQFAAFNISVDPTLALALANISIQQFDFIVGTVEISGQYSVWLTVWNRLNRGQATNLLTELQNRAAHPGKRHFKGTDLANTVLPELANIP